MDYKKLRGAYASHKCSAAKRGIGWVFTFDTWLDKWEQSGKLHVRGCTLGQYVMSRPGDIGPYSDANTRIITCSENHVEANAGKPAWNSGKKCPQISKAKKGVPNPVLAAKFKNRKVPWSKKAMIVNGELFDSVVEAAANVGVATNTIRRWALNNKNGVKYAGVQ